jgi:uncharacterized membrane protein
MARKLPWSPDFASRWTLLPIRVVLGVGFLLHGLAKWHRGPAKFGLLLQQAGVPFPLHTAWLVTFLEVFGGAALIAGVLVTLVSVPLIISMVVAIYYGARALRIQFGEHDWPDSIRTRLRAARVRNQPSLYRGLAGVSVVRTNGLVC